MYARSVDRRQSSAEHGEDGMARRPAVAHEFRTLADVHHPHVVRLGELFEDEQRLRRGIAQVARGQWGPVISSHAWG